MLKIHEINLQRLLLTQIPKRYNGQCTGQAARKSYT